MKFVINTSFDPHFCALFDEKNQLIAEKSWMIPREDGQKAWDFLKTHLTPDAKLTFIGGVSGPGSFSSLRVGGAILNALAFKFKLPIHQARAEVVLQDYLKSEKLEGTTFLLNSFSDRIFTVENKNLVPQSVTRLDTTTPYITAWLPENKATHFKNSILTDALGPLKTILNTLEKEPSQKGFIPDYEYPAIQS